MPSKDTATATGRNNLLQRKLTWYARYFVPLALQSAFGKKEVQRTLQTRDKMEARRRLPTALSQLQREVAEAVRKRMPLDLSSAAVVLEELESIEAAVRRGEYSVSADPMDLDPVELAVENLLDQHSAHLGGRDPVSGHSRLITHQVWAAAEHTLRVHQDPRYKPLSEWIRLHIEALKSKGRKRSTYLARERHLGDFLEWAGASRDPRTFSDEDVVTYADRLNDKSASVRSRRDTAGHVRAFFEWLKKNRRIVPNNPFADLRDQINGDPSEEGTNKREWEAEELRRILTGFHSSGRLWTIAVIALYSGMRINEVCSLELKDITNRGMEVTKRNAKNMNSERVVPIHPIIAP
ncbi:MAG TPA: site-specific integrase, partial [Gemmatimonadaceae bacterium]|nr:site-specific integrase [Gemmatimonadaceae bacterium]